MTYPQLATLLLLAGLLVTFAAGRLRIELVALGGLAAGLLLGVVPVTEAFSGFANSAVITVAEILILARLIARSHLMDGLTLRLEPFARSERSLLLLVCSLGAFTSVFMNNIGALALWLPVALALCRSSGVAAEKVLMPLSFATLLGGTCSLIGTPANLVVANVAKETAGKSFGFFDIAAVGVPVSIAGILVLAALAPRILAGRSSGALPARADGVRPYFAEIRITLDSNLAGLSVAEAERSLAGRIHTHLRGGRHVFGSKKHREILAGDIVLIEADAATIANAYRSGVGELVTAQAANASHVWVEAVVLPQSILLGSSARTAAAFAARNISVVALATRLQRIEGRLADLQFRVGDLLLLHGEPNAIGAALEEVDLLAVSPLTDVPAKRQGWLVLAAFIGAIALAATNLVPPEIAFGLALLLLAATDSLDLRVALADLNWPILVMLAAMIPLGEAVARTGLADLIAQQAIAVVGTSAPWLLIATVLSCAVALTPFVNNVSAAVSLAPIAAALAQTADIPPEPLLFAVAIGVSLDFLTPFGHHNNALVMSVAGYRFSDFARLGLPLLLVTILVALATICLLRQGTSF